MEWDKKGHQFDALGKFFVSKRVYIYGAGYVGARVYSQLDRYNIVDAFIDRDIIKQKEGYCTKLVLNPSVVFENIDDKHIIIIAIEERKTARLMMRRFQLTGYIKNVNVFFWNEFVPDESTSDYTDNLLFRIFTMYSQNKIWLDSIAIFPITRCNLNCEHCLAFTPYIGNHITKSFEQLKHEVDLFFKWVDYVRWFQICGGETLLFVELPELIDYIGTFYRNRIGQRFEIVTNGTIMPSKELLLRLQKYNMNVVIDDYGENYGKLKNKALEIREVLHSNGIDYIYDKPNRWVDLDVFNCDNSDKNLVDYFDSCGIPFHTNESGKIYACPYCDFAHKAGIIGDDKDDYFDLNQKMTKKTRKEFFEFTLGYSNKGYASLCKNCRGWVETINNNYVEPAKQKHRTEYNNQ